MDDKLYAVVDYIMNTAGEAELEVVHAALKKRVEEARSIGPDPRRLAAESTGRIDEQLDMSKRMVKQMAAGFAADIIRQNAPELSEAQVQQLLGEFLPEMAGGKPARQKAGGSGGSAAPSSGGLPGSMVIQMVNQFLDFSEGRMSAAEQVQLEQDIPGWKQKYWQSFPSQVQKLLSLYLNGDIDRQRFEAHICEVLGL